MRKGYDSSDSGTNSGSKQTGGGGGDECKHDGDHRRGNKGRTIQLVSECVPYVPQHPPSHSRPT